MAATVVAVHAARERPGTGFAKQTRPGVTLVAAHGVSGDVHAGARALRQVHLVDVARYDLLRSHGHDLSPGDLGENVTTAGLDLLALGAGTVLRLGGSAVLRLTGVRHPRHDEPATDPHDLLLDDDGVPVGRVGVFAVVLTGGAVAAGDPVTVEHPGGGRLPPL